MWCIKTIALISSFIIGQAQLSAGEPICPNASVALESEPTDSVGANLDITEVTVMSNKVNRRNIAPAAVTLLGARQLQVQQISDIEDISSKMSNIFIPDYGSRQTTPIVIRGIYSKAKGTTVGFYVDGMPHFEISAFDTDMLDVKSIEVFRGPQGTLYGRNTIGGVINVYKYTPFEYQGTRLRLRYGNYNNFKVQASNYSLFNENVGLNISGYYEHRDGYFDNITIHKKADKLNTAGGRLTLHFKPADNWEIRLLANLDYLNQGGYPYATYDVATKRVSDVNYNRPCGYERLITNSGIKIKYTSDMWSLNSQTSYQYIDDNQKVDQDFTDQDIYFATSAITHRIVSEELTAKSEHDGSFQWIAGTFMFNQAGDQEQGTDYITKRYEQHSYYDNDLRGIALFAQASYNVWKGLSATVGARIDYEYNRMVYHREQVNYTDSSTAPVGNPFNQSMEATEFIPRFGLQYLFNGDNTLFVNISRGYKGGGFNVTIPTDELRTYNPEHNWNYEVGAKLGTSDHSFMGELTLFYIDWNNQHVSQVIPGLGTVVSNAGHSDSKGIEMMLLYRPTANLTLQGNYGYTYARFLNYVKDESKGQIYTGNMVPMVPRHTLGFNASYSIYPTSCLDAINITAGITGTGKLYWLEDNAVCQRFYVLPNARVEFRKGIVALSLWGKNLSNTEYLSYYFVSSAKYAQKGTPLTLGADIVVNF